MCLICTSATHPVATYDDYVAVAATATDERQSIYSYFKTRPQAAFREIITCNTCGFARVDPLPSAEELNTFYQSYWANSSYSQKHDKKIRRTLKRLRGLKRYVAGGTFLDVGCNVGFAVEAARRAGFSATGIEIDAEAVAYASKQFPQNHFAATTIENYAPAAPFDLVHCTEVIEHVIDPVAFAAHLARLTKPGGYLFLTTPDAGHWRVPKRFIDWPEVKPLEHITWQTRKSITKLLLDQGFESPRIAWKLKTGLRVLARRKVA